MFCKSCKYYVTVSNRQEVRTDLTVSDIGNILCINYPLVVIGGIAVIVLAFGRTNTFV
jgi:hypothetical protein